MKLLDPLMRFDLIDIINANIDWQTHHEAQTMARKLAVAGKYTAATEDEIEAVDKLLDKYSPQ